MSPLGVLSAWLANLRDPAMRAAFAIGFCILFAFIGTFTYVNFVLVRAALRPGHDVARVGVFRVPAVGADHAAGRTRRRALRHAHHLRRRTGACRTRTAADAAALAAGGAGWAWCWSASARSSHRRSPPGSSVARRAPTARLRAAPISPAISWAASWAAWRSGRCIDRLGWTACVVGIGLALIASIALTPRLRLPQES